MNPKKVVLDTNIVIDLLKKVPTVVAQFLDLQAKRTQFLICPIVIAEVYAGAFPREYNDIEAFFNLCYRIDMDGETGRIAGLYAKQFSKAYQGIALEDFILAATAYTYRCPLWTHNRKHYPMTDIELLIFNY